MSTKVMIVDSHGIMRDGLHLLINNDDNLEVVGKAVNGRQAVELAAKLKPDVLLMEVSMPVLNGIEATRQILKANRNIKVLALSAHSERQFVTEMLKAGASAYVLKESVADELIKAIEMVAAGQRYLSPKVAGIVIDNLVGSSSTGANTMSLDNLTPKERELLQLLAEGEVTKSAARKLHVSIKTIDARRRVIMNKLNMNSVAQLTKFAIREGVTSLDF